VLEPSILAALLEALSDEALCCTVLVREREMSQAIEVDIDAI
jgi:hypothetical protein